MHLLGEVSPEIQARIQQLSLEKLDLLAEEIFELSKGSAKNPTNHGQDDK